MFLLFVAADDDDVPLSGIVTYLRVRPVFMQDFVSNVAVPSAFGECVFMLFRIS